MKEQAKLVFMQTLRSCFDNQNGNSGIAWEAMKSAFYLMVIILNVDAEETAIGIQSIYNSLWRNSDIVSADNASHLTKETLSRIEAYLKLI